MARGEVANLRVSGIIQKTGWGEWHLEGSTKEQPGGATKGHLEGAVLRGRRSSGKLHAIDFSSSYTCVDKILSEAVRSWEKTRPHFEVRNIKVRRIHPRLWSFRYELHRKDSVFPFN